MNLRRYTMVAVAGIEASAAVLSADAAANPRVSAADTDAYQGYVRPATANGTDLDVPVKVSYLGGGLYDLAGAYTRPLLSST